MSRYGHAKLSPFCVLARYALKLTLSCEEQPHLPSVLAISGTCPESQCSPDLAFLQQYGMCDIRSPRLMPIGHLTLAVGLIIRFSFTRLPYWSYAPQYTKSLFSWLGWVHSSYVVYVRLQVRFLRKLHVQYAVVRGVPEVKTQDRFRRRPYYDFFSHSVSCVIDQAPVT